jgi:prepilin-type N-terminal cleavage/methylation domain-containing protein
MKLTNTRIMKAKSGMTLLELTVVILVLLSLISILFIGARAWKKGSDRAGNILNIRNVQQAVRGYANIRAMNIGDALASTEIVGSGKYLTNVKAPNADITYTYGTTIPDVGTLYLIASYGNSSGADYAPGSATYADW